MRQPYTHQCPDCGMAFNGPSALTDHALSVHVAAETPAAHIRPPHPWVYRAATAAGLAGFAGFLVLLTFSLAGALDTPGAPEQPQSAAHELAVTLRESGEIDRYRSVEPKDGWDAEYELDGSDGVVRSRFRGARDEVEWQAYSDDLRKAIEQAARDRGFGRSETGGERRPA